ncbi:aldehyde dehydrogenase [Staphylococcus hyicus]|uniref:aldehyde dehydrogenase n=1 Tax=Staphylococcus hyicus TaxID=1284 RepID=UPI00208E1B84|nr:aldehyde dehydrogenase [Staphylococcus hyicus]MCO4332515.1 aldehyde dehydrogenase [Staphylococcus hyicus]MCO4333610.1 aldehyde dehydrogenase [Staphylococcus hyicus]
MLFDASETYFKSQATKPLAFRKQKLKALKKNIKLHEKALYQALKEDLGKHSVEAFATEIGYTLNSINHYRKDLKKWARKRAVETPFFLFPAKSFLMKEPLGTVLIIGPFNYPFQLVMEPLIGAIAAGNTAIVKPSELTPNVSKVIQSIIEATFEETHVSVIQGGKDTIQSLLDLPFDHIFFTGSTKVGQIVYEAASKHLTPVTLELGGKSPTIIDKTANLKVASERICFGKFLNLGQTCVAPDYVLIDESMKDDFIDAMRTTLKEFYGTNPQKSHDLGRIVNDQHFHRLSTLLETHKDQIVIGGAKDQSSRFIEPTILDNIHPSDDIMQEEIFGPLLPIVTYQSFDTALSWLQSRPKPLALYVFTEDENFSTLVLDTLSFGSGAVNDTLLQLANPKLPFGGVGASGIGRYHGKYTFDTFTHEKPYIFKTTKLETGILFPPYKGKLNMIKQLFTKNKS